MHDRPLQVRARRLAMQTWFLVVIANKLLREPIPENYTIESEPTMVNAPVQEILRYRPEESAISRIASIVAQNKNA
jgi:hypothetical protein